jgi:hypothetical protein
VRTLAELADLVLVLLEVVKDDSRCSHGERRGVCSDRCRVSDAENVTEALLAAQWVEFVLVNRVRRQ